MPTVKFENGLTVNFDQTPSQQDIDEAFAQLTQSQKPGIDPRAIAENVAPNTTALMNGQIPFVPGNHPIASKLALATPVPGVLDVMHNVVGRPVAAVEGGIAEAIAPEPRFSSMGENIAKRDIPGTVTRGFINPREAPLITQRLPFTKWELEGGKARLIPRAIAEAGIQYGLTGGINNLPGKVSKLVETAKAAPLLALQDDILKAVRAARQAGKLEVPAELLKESATVKGFTDFDILAAREIGTRLEPQQAEALLRQRSIPNLIKRFMDEWTKPKVEPVAPKPAPVQPQEQPGIPVVKPEAPPVAAPSMADLIAKHREWAKSYPAVMPSGKVPVRYMGPQLDEAGQLAFQMVDEPSGSTVAYDPAKHEIVTSRKGVEIPQEIQPPKPIVPAVEPPVAKPVQAAPPETIPQTEQIKPPVQPQVEGKSLNAEDVIPTDAMAIFNRQFYNTTGGIQIPESFWDGMTAGKLINGFENLGLGKEIISEASAALYKAGYRRIGNLSITESGIVVQPKPPTPAKPSAKEPWEMTKTEFWREGAGGKSSEGRGTSDYNHKQSVKQAIAEGKPVPASVLAEYPDLQKQKVAETVRKIAEPEGVEVDVKGGATKPSALFRKATTIIYEEGGKAISDGRILELNPDTADLKELEAKYPRPKDGDQSGVKIRTVEMPSERIRKVIPSKEETPNKLGKPSKFIPRTDTSELHPYNDRYKIKEAEKQNEIYVYDLKGGKLGLNAYYVKYIARKGWDIYAGDDPDKPVRLVKNGKTVGALMPIAKAAEALKRPEKFEREEPKATYQPGFKPGGSTSSSGAGSSKGYGPTASELSQEPATIPNVSQIRPVKSPELVSLAKELTGSYPKLKKLKVYSGFFSTPSGKITLDERLFKNPEYVEKVLAHEIGHLMDWLPNETLKRGNLIGRALSMTSQFMKGTFGELNNAVLRKELLELTHFWHPFDEKTAPASYVAYRKSAVELYAEFVSVMLNSPAKAKELAPNFYNAFFENIDKKPEVRAAFFGLQELLASGDDAVLKQREANIVGMFERGEQSFRQKNMQREQAKKSIGFMLKYFLIDKNSGLLEVRNRIAAKGTISAERDPKYLVEQYPMVGAKVSADLDDFAPIYDGIQKAGLSFDKDFGQFLFLKRIVGERGEIANPLGHTPETAKSQLFFMRKRLGDEKYAKLEELEKQTRAWFQKGNKQLYDAGMLTDEQFSQVSENDDYAPFRVLAHYKDWMSAGLIAQSGTLGEIANPATSLILKKIAMVRAAERNQVTKSLANFLLSSGDMTAGKVINYPDSGPPRMQEKEGLTSVMWKEGGKWRGGYTDPYIAKSLKYDRNETLQAIGNVIAQISLNRTVFRPLYITFNLGFQSYNVVRDFMRFWKNTPGMTMAKATSLYMKAYPHAVARVQEKLDPLIQQMQREGALSITYNEMLKGQTDEDKEIDAILHRYGIGEHPTNNYKLLAPLKGLLDGIEYMGNVIETIPKVAGYMGQPNVPPQERAYYVRNLVGTPNPKRQGAGYDIYNNAFLFSNVVKEGWRGDIEAATVPKTRSGWWWKTVKASILPKIAMAGAAAGYFGAEYKKAMDSASEYDKANHLIIPIGKNEKSKTVYLRLVQDQTSQFLGALFWKSLTREGLQDILFYAGGQLPDPSPLFNILRVWSDFGSGVNPRDSFTGREILTDDELKAGGNYALAPMLRWTMNQTGQVKLDLRDRFKDETMLEKIIHIAPIVNRWIRISDQGLTEQAQDIQQPVIQEMAAERIERRRALADALKAHLSEKEVMDKTKAGLDRQLKAGEITRQEASSRFRATRDSYRELTAASNDPIARALRGARSWREQVPIMEAQRKTMGQKAFKDYVEKLYSQGLLTRQARAKINAR